MDMNITCILQLYYIPIVMANWWILHYYLHILRTSATTLLLDLKVSTWELCPGWARISPVYLSFIFFYSYSLWMKPYIGHTFWASHFSTNSGWISTKLHGYRSIIAECAYLFMFGFYSQRLLLDFKETLWELCVPKWISCMFVSGNFFYSYGHLMNSVLDIYIYDHIYSTYFVSRRILNNYWLDFKETP